MCGCLIIKEEIFSQIFADLIADVLEKSFKSNLSDEKKYSFLDNSCREKTESARSLYFSFSIL